MNEITIDDSNDPANNLFSESILDEDRQNFEEAIQKKVERINMLKDRSVYIFDY